MRATTPNRLTSLGSIASRTYAPATTVLRIARRLGITPALLLDGLPFFAESDAERVAEAVRAAMETRGQAAVGR